MEIIPNVYLGNKKVANNADYLKSKNIGYVLNCTTNIKNYFENVKKVQQIRIHRHVEFGFQPKPQVNLGTTPTSTMKTEPGKNPNNKSSDHMEDDGLIFDEESNQEEPINDGQSFEVIPSEKSLTSYDNAEIMGESDIPAHKLEDEENELMDLSNEGWEVGTEDSVMIEEEDSIQNIVIENIPEEQSKNKMVDILEEKMIKKESTPTTQNLQLKEEKPTKFGQLFERAKLHQDRPVGLDDIMQQIKSGAGGIQNAEADKKEQLKRIKEELDNQVTDEANQHIQNIADNVNKIINQKASPLPPLPEAEPQAKMPSAPIQKSTHTQGKHIFSEVYLNKEKIPHHSNTAHPNLKSLIESSKQYPAAPVSEVDQDIKHLKEQTELHYHTALLPKNISKLPVTNSINLKPTLDCHVNVIEDEEDTKYITVEFEKPVQYLRVPVHDSMEQDLSKYWDSAAEFIQHAVNSNSGVLVHCREGKSRSVSMIIAYALKFCDMSLQDIYNKVSELAPIRPNDGFKIQLMDLERELRNESSINFFENRSAKFKRSFSEMMASAYGEFDDDMDFNDEDGEDWGWTPQRAKRMGKRNPISFKMFQAHFKGHGRQLRLTDMLKIKKKKEENVNSEVPKPVEPVKPPPKKKKKIQMTLSAFVKKK